MLNKILFFLLLIVLPLWAATQEIPERPDPPRLVNDFAQVLDDGQEQQFETELVQFANQTSTQIVVVTVSSLDGYDVSDYAFRLGEKWGVGQKDKSNGIVVLFKPKTKEEKGQVFVAVGYGLEGVIPDATANREVIDFEMIPRFKEGDVFGGLYNGTKVLMALAAGEYTAEAYSKTQKNKQSGGTGIVILILVFLFVVLPLINGRRKRFYTGGSSLPFWLAMGMMSSGRDSHRGSWGNFSGGSGGFGGGGFGGFGGGSFGGGGAGGSW